MKVNRNCEECLWKRQQKLSDDPVYLSHIRKILDSRRENDCAPYLIYLFNKVYENRFGDRPDYSSEKKRYNDLILSLEESFTDRINSSDSPLKTALLYARVGNYIDFGALQDVNERNLFELFDHAKLSESDEIVYNSFINKCMQSKNFLLIADNCGEIVLDKLFLIQLKSAFPQLQTTVMVRGGEALNDVTINDARYVGIDQYARIITNGAAISGTVYELLSEEAKQIMNTSDIIFAKGQGNYESLSGQGFHIFYSFLCKCDLFINKFNVPKFTGMFLET